jgi:hypothetical protein
MPGPDAGHPLQCAGSYQYLPACALSGESNDYLVSTLGDRGNGARRPGHRGAWSPVLAFYRRRRAHHCLSPRRHVDATENRQETSRSVRAPAVSHARPGATLGATHANDSPVVMEDQAPECHGAHRQNDSVPFSANVSTSRRGTCVSEQDVQLAATAQSRPMGGVARHRLTPPSSWRLPVRAPRC